MKCLSFLDTLWMIFYSLKPQILCCSFFPLSLALFPMRNLNVFSSELLLYLTSVLLLSLWTVLLCSLLDSKRLKTGSSYICNSSVFSIVLARLVLIKLSSHWWCIVVTSEELDLVHLTNRLKKWYVLDCSVFKISKMLGWILFLSGKVYIRNIIMNCVKAFDQERIEEEHKSEWSEWKQILGRLGFTVFGNI